MTSDARSIHYLRLTPDATAAPAERSVDRSGPPHPVAVGATAPVADDWEGAAEAPTAAATEAAGWGTDAPSRSLETRLFVLDLVGVTASWVAVGAQVATGPTLLDRLAPGLAGAAVTLLAMRVLHLYRARRCARRSEELGRIVVASLWGAAAFLAFQAPVASPGPQGLAAAGAAVVTAGTVRWQFGRFLRACRARGRHLRRVLLVGCDGDAAALRTMLESEPELGYAVAGLVGDAAGDAAWAQLPSSPSVDDIPGLAVAARAGGVLIAPYGMSSERLRRAITVATDAGLHVQVWSGLLGVGSRRLRSAPVSGEPFFYVEPRAVARWQVGVKRAIDVAGASLGLVVVAPVLALAGLLVKLEDGGPVFHRGPRVGMHGEPFVAYKIRTMSQGERVAAADLAALNQRTDGPLFKAANDPRVTRVGRILRASSIDELPQLWNVLQGTMSLVGPRPALPTEVVEFDDELRRRHSVRPGITGLWQVEARRNPSFNAYRRLDLRYVDDWSLSLDLAILATTVPAVIGQAIGEVRGRREARRSAGAP